MSLHLKTKTKSNGCLNIGTEGVYDKKHNPHLLHLAA